MHFAREQKKSSLSECKVVKVLFSSVYFCLISPAIDKALWLEDDQQPKRQAEPARLFDWLRVDYHHSARHKTEIINYCAKVK